MSRLVTATVEVKDSRRVSINMPTALEKAIEAVAWREVVPFVEAHEYVLWRGLAAIEKEERR